MRIKTIIVVSLALASSAGCKKQVDMVLPDSGATTTAATTTTKTPTTVATDDTPPPLATLAPTKAPPMPVFTSKPAGSNAAATTPSGANPPECDAAKVMLANGRQAEYETLKQACIGKGGKL